MSTTNNSIFSQFFSGTVFIGIARMSTIVLGLVSVMLATRYLTTDAYGAYILVMLFGNFFVQFMDFGFGLVVPKYLASEDENEEYKTTLTNSVIHFRIIVVLVVLIIVFFFQRLLAGFIENEMSVNIITGSAIVFSLISFSQLFETILRGHFKFKTIGIIEFISEIAELILLILLVVVFQIGFWGLVLAKVVTRAIWISLAYRAIKLNHKWELDISLIKEMLKFGFPLQLQYILQFAYSKVDTLIVGSFLGTSGIALYDVARKIPDSLDQLFSVFITVYFPLSANIYSTEKKEKTDYIINNSVRLLSVFAFFATLVTVFFGEEIILLLFSEEYLPVYWALVLLMIGFALQMVESIFGYSLVAIGEPDKPLYINIVRAVVSLVGNVLILPIMGFTGAAVIYILGNLVAIPLNVFYLRRKSISPKYIDFIKLTLAFALLFLVFFISGQINFFIRTFIVLLYIPLCFLLSVLTIRDVSIVFDEIRSITVNIKEKYLKKSSAT